MPSHFKGPLLGSRYAGDGLFENLPLSPIDRVRSRYSVWLEEFNEEFATGQLILNGAHVDDLNTATAPTQVVTSETGYLLINPGTKADAGSSIVFDIAPTAAALGNAFNSPRALTSTTTLMDNRELIWAARVGLMTDTVASWEGKSIFGWLAADTTPIDTATGLPAMATGCGAGFCIDESGNLAYFGQQTALTTFPTTLVAVQPFSSDGIAAAGIPEWHEFGFRIKWIDASSGTGTIDYYVDNRWVGRITNGLPMASTEVYASTFAIANGPNAILVDLTVDYLMVAITKPGLTNTSQL